MTNKLTVTKLANLQNDTTATSTINNNLDAIATAMDNTLSRNGAQPNWMGSDLDMNNHHILNLPAPINGTEPLRLIDVATLNGSGTINSYPLPVGGSTGQVLTKNSATNYDASWKFTFPLNALQFNGVDPSGTTDSTAGLNTAIQSAISQKKSLLIPAGTYQTTGPLIINGLTCVYGEGPYETVIKNFSTTQDTIQFSAFLTGVQLHSMTLTRANKAVQTAAGIRAQGDMQECSIYNIITELSGLGMAMQSASYGEIYRVIAQNNSNHGFFFTNSAGVNGGNVQWVIDSCLAQSNGTTGLGGSGYLVAANPSGTPANDPIQITMGTWSNCYANGNVGFGCAVNGTGWTTGSGLTPVGIPIQGFRLFNAFIGGDGSDELFLNTFGGSHTIQGCFFEVSGGMGINCGGNNFDAHISGCVCSGNTGTNILINTLSNTFVGNCRSVNSIGGYGFDIGNGALVCRDSNISYSNSLGDVRIQTNSTSGVGAGNATGATMTSTNVLNTGLGSLAASVTPIANSLLLRDSSGNAYNNNEIITTAQVATAASTTTLTAASAGIQIFTGTTTQIVSLPVTSTVLLGWPYTFMNNSTGAVTINSSGGNQVTIIPPGGYARVTLLATTGTTATSWDLETNYLNVASGKSPTINNSITLSGTDGTTMTFPGSSDTVATLASAQNLTNKTSTTQSAGDNSTKLATTAYADASSAAAILANTRKRLSANTTFFVSTTGSNANNGTAVGTPWQTIQFAYDTIANNYDLNGFTATIQLANGTYTTGLTTSKGVVGGNGPGAVMILGSATPSNVIISTTSNDCFGIGETAFGSGSQGTTQITIGGMRLQTTTAGNCVNVSGGGCGVVVGTPGFPIDFGVCVQDHMIGNHSAWIIAGTNNTISGSALIHVAGLSNAVVALHGTTETFTGTPAFTYYAFADVNASLYLDSMTFTGSATGVRYFVQNNSNIYTLSNSAAYLPGNASGVEQSKGNYVTANPSVWTTAQGGTGVDINQTSGQQSVQGLLHAGALQINVKAVNFNSANTDTAIAINLPTGCTTYLIQGIRISNASAVLTTSTVGVFTATGGGGVAVCTNQANTLSTTAANTLNNIMAVPQVTSNIGWTAPTLYFRVGTAQGSAATADVTVTIFPL